MQRFFTASEALPVADWMLWITVLHCALTAQRE